MLDYLTISCPILQSWSKDLQRDLEEVGLALRVLRKGGVPMEVRVVSCWSLMFSRDCLEEVWEWSDGVELGLMRTKSIDSVDDLSRHFPSREKEIFVRWKRSDNEKERPFPEYPSWLFQLLPVLLLVQSIVWVDREWKVRISSVVFPSVWKGIPPRWHCSRPENSTDDKNHS